MSVTYKQQTCNEQLQIEFNGNNVLNKDLSISPCYNYYQKTLTFDWNQYVGSINNILIIQITSSPTATCSFLNPGINPQIQSENQVQKVYYQQLTNNLCPSFADIHNIELCSSCQNQQNRVIDNGRCVCKKGYYEQSSSPICIACLPTCKSCQDTIGCLDCFENASLLYNQCVCNAGYFMNDSFRCQKCNVMCKTCYFTENYCTLCIDKNQILPNCSCPNGMFFDPVSSSCKNCNSNCYTCSYNKQASGQNQCTSCAAGFINSPICQIQCTAYEIFDYERMECVPLVCDNKCVSCDGNSFNCLKCKGNRINPPTCQCQQNYYDDGQSTDCVKCPDGQYFGMLNDNQKGCLPCHFSCKHCSGPNINQCTKCYNDSFLQNSDGYCQCVGANMTLFKDELDNNLPKCVTSLNINLSIYINSEFQQIYRISFSDTILQKISSDLIMQNLSIYLEGTPKSEYTFQQTFYDQNMLEFVMISQKVIPRQKLFVIALKQNYFQGVSNTILDIKYVENPIFVKMVQDNVDYSSSQRNLAELKAASESVQNNPFVQFDNLSSVKINSSAGIKFTSLLSQIKTNTKSQIQIFLSNQKMMYQLMNISNKLGF
ncbi:hypothetical protein TTHERM_00056150 (macronuclear) [Tetrahymena thermophila SB210]|uniref:EGF-like domain-containing protein n=1 Tax=Tetrahymena thermophila (strain SB210) TaxID=312017 RepID=I7M0C3_TETTS|nr:hypothetical protein TTHERM_00056150 [Tetrahymena thermophila SB210]EAR87301.2 hypothetical protein TTHERM_00056150 [Tetrahymena thermophila SB210]|eukprot:XP_001007546.2 hypothetical protein TTHERM_00056150 [Tetrahymena thermophila SB210]